MLPAADVRRELVAVLAGVAADVALKRLAEAVTAHVDGEHDVVQKDDAAVSAVEGAHGPAGPVQHLQAVPGRTRRARAPLYCSGGYRSPSVPLCIQVFGSAGAGGEMAAGQCGRQVVEVVVVGGTCRGCRPCALLFCRALCVRGVRAAVGRSGAAACRALVVTAFARLPSRKAKGHRCQPNSAVGPGALRGHVAVDGAHDCAEFRRKAGVELRRRGRLVVLGFPPGVVEVWTNQPG